MNEVTKVDEMPKKLRAEEPEQPYIVGRWNDLPNYQCLQCSFATTDLVVMERHIDERHAPPPTTVTVTVPIYDRFGNLVTEREV